MISLIATTEKTQCTAFGKRDKRRCRLERRSGFLTCRVHANYYETWYQTHYLFDRRQMGKREREEVEFQIQRGYVTIPTEWVQRFYTPGEKEWYPFLLEHTDISPLENIPCFEHLIYAKFLHRYIGNWIHPSEFNPYIRNPDCALFVFRMTVNWCSLMSHGGFYSFLDLMKVYLSQLDWRPILYSAACLDTFEDVMVDLQATFPNQNDIYDLANPINPIAKFLKKFHKRVAKGVYDRCAIYKEELMAAAWAPRRIQRWLDMGYDLDLLDAL
jgi:hypothetical protein